ncbi:MAG TPA: ADP-ribosylglycohydrolase family protein [Chloroflexi bacterium]|nr:ADP-ribosylglycohydrolase family protein [Chloroflexota bacterium]
MGDDVIDVTGLPLYDRIYGSLLASAVGDAMGGPVEGLCYTAIAQRYGVVDTCLPYDFAPDYHNHFRTTAGSVTDDTRLRCLVARAVTEADPVRYGLLPRRGDLLKVLVETYYGSDDALTRGFLEEYVLGGLYGQDRLAWDGQPTNGFLMANAPLGLICPGEPDVAFGLSFALDFISGGYARISAAMGAAAVAAAAAVPAAAVSEATVEAVVEAMFQAAQRYRRIGPQTRQWQWYATVFELNERLVGEAVEIALRYRDVLAVREDYYKRLAAGPLGSEAAQTLAVALGMLVAAGGDLRLAIIGAVNYGRDCDSYASLAGAIAGAMHGVDAIPNSWRTVVRRANPELDLPQLSRRLTEVAWARQQQRQRVTAAVAPLLSPLARGDGEGVSAARGRTEL